MITRLQQRHQAKGLQYISLSMGSRLRKTGMVMILLLCIFFVLPIPLKIKENSPFSVVVEDENGQLLSAQIAKDGQWRFPVMDSLPSGFIKAITAYEDERFYYHPGVDPLALIRAIGQNIRAGKIVSGASTITMQLIRLSEGHGDRSLKNKIIESLQALHLESRYTKNEILRYYASYAPFGGNVVGLETASWRYFNKAPGHLSWAEMATLCVLPNSPSLIRLDKNRKQLLKKRNSLLDKLYARGDLTSLDHELALAEPLVPAVYPLPRNAYHLLERAKSFHRQGRIITTLNSEFQVGCQRILDDAYVWLQEMGIENAALVVIDNSTGAVKAYVGNIASAKQEYAVDMIRGSRSSGSILKPILYAVALDEGLITADSWLEDVPLFFDGFTPANYDRSFSGVVPASQALSRSLNVPFVSLLREYGVEKFRRLLYNMGLTTVDADGSHYGLSLILGGAEVNLYQLTSLYAAMAHQLSSGAREFLFEVSPYQVRKTEDSVISTPVSRASIYNTFAAMRNVIRPDEYGEWEQYSSSYPIAWKTGTSFGHRDAWAIGVSPRYSVGVWAGNADGEGRDELIGSKVAGRIMFSVWDMLSLSEDWFEEPRREIHTMELCAVSGYKTSVHCVDKKILKIGGHHDRIPVCSYHRTVRLDSSGRWEVNNRCYDGEIIKRSVLKFEPLVAHHYYQNHPESEHGISMHPECREYAYQNDIQIVYPHAGEKIFIPRDFSDRRQKLLLQVKHHDPDVKVFWYLDKRLIATTIENHEVAIDQIPGDYQLYCTDENGKESKMRFEIIGPK